MTTSDTTGHQYAAVDLGSNSFHMVVAQQGFDGRLTVVDRIKKNVRLAGGLGPSGDIDRDAEDRALQCLSSFGERLVDIPHHHVRAVGTNTLRKAKNAVEFLKQAEAALGHPIDVISGREEARLIYRGVVRDVEERGRLLVIDIGGGSTELIVGEGSDPTRLDSLFMGCVSWSKRYFPNGVITEPAFNNAVLAARAELHSVVRAYRKAGWDSCVGSSGTINAIERILLAQGFRNINADGLDWLIQSLIAAKKTKNLSLDGLSSDRRPVIAGGVAILQALFQELRLTTLRATTNALREGVLLELVGRERHHDIRDDTVKRMMARFEVDARHAFRVSQTAGQVFDQLQASWNLTAYDRQLLNWAASLHEVGMFLTYSGYHKHGAYLLTHHEMPGFSRQDQRTLAGLVNGHRGVLHKTPRLAEIATASEFSHLLAILRIAARIHRRRSPKPPPRFTVTANQRQITIVFPDDWLSGRPLTRQDLEKDGIELGNLGYKLKISTVEHE